MTQARKRAVHAYAKINLGLEVLGRRSDGLHEVATIMQTIDLADRLEFEPSDQVRLHCPEMPVEPDNLILQAAHLLKDRGSVAEGCQITCVKHIPPAAGLGGGSADAAATLCALWGFWGVRLDQRTLVDLAARLGADVPFCISGGTALATGTGRDLEILPLPPPLWVVLIPTPAPGPLKTDSMYAALTAADFTDGGRMQLQRDALCAGHLDYSAIRSAFEGHARARWTDVGRALDMLAESGALAASVSGSGPSTFGLFRSREEAVPVLDTLGAAGVRASLHRFVGPVDCRARANELDQ